MPKKTRVGTIVSTKMMDTVTVLVERMKVHSLYNKRYRVTKKYHADTAGQQYELGDVVMIEEIRPLSKTKSWKVVQKVEAKG